MQVEEPRPRERGEYDEWERMNLEKEVLGFFVSSNPMERNQETLSLVRTAETGEIKDIADGTWLPGLSFV